MEVKRVTQGEFANQLGVTQGLVHQWISGRTRITAERAKQIEEVTEGKVSRHDLRPDLFDEKEAA